MYYLIIGFSFGIIATYGLLKRKYFHIVLYRIFQNYWKTIRCEGSNAAEVQVNLPLVEGSVSGYIDKNILIEEFEKMKENNLVLEKRLTELSDMVRLGEESEEKQMSKYLQLCQCENSLLTNLARPHTQTGDSYASLVQYIHDKIDEFSKYQQWVTEKVNEKLRIIGCDIETIKKYFENVSNTIFDDLEKNLISIKSNSEKSFSKYEALETWIQTLEKDVTKNNLSIIALDHSYQALELARSQNSGSASIFSPDYSQPGAFVAAPSTVTYDKSPVPKPPGPYFVPPTPFCPPPPPPPPPPPAPKVSNADKSSSQKVYHRIPITTEVLKSVVLKSPGERKLKGCVLSPK